MKELQLAAISHQDVLPEARPMLWPLRPASSAEVTDEVLGTGQRRITIRHAPLHGVTPEMLSWWYGGNIVGTMHYAGQEWPRYLVWHPLDHISYEIVEAGSDGAVGPGSRIRVREAFQRDPGNLLEVTVEVERLDERMAIIPGSRALAWARHHIEEIGNLENFLPGLWEADAGHGGAGAPVEREVTA
jgi:hypothetical protein